MPWINCIDWILTSIWLMKLLTFTTSVTILVLHVPSFHTRNPTLPNPGTSPVLTTTFVILPELSWELLTAETCLVVSLLPYPILILNGPSHWSYTRDFERCLFCCHFWFPLEHKTCIWIYTLNVLASRLAVEIMKILEPFTLTSLFLKHDLSLYSSCAFEPRCCRFSLPYKLF